MNENMAKLMVVAGLVIATVGGVIWLLIKSGFRGMPGDIHVERSGWTFSFPIVTCILISIILTVVLNLIARR